MTVRFFKKCTFLKHFSVLYQGYLAPHLCRKLDNIIFDSLSNVNIDSMFNISIYTYQSKDMIMIKKYYSQNTTKYNNFVKKIKDIFLHQIQEFITLWILNCFQHIIYHLKTENMYFFNSQKFLKNFRNFWEISKILKIESFFQYFRNFSEIQKKFRIKITYFQFFNDILY